MTWISIFDLSKINLLTLSDEVFIIAQLLETAIIII